MPSAQLKVRLFAGAKESAGADSIVCEMELPANVARLKSQLIEQDETLRPYVEFGRIAINNEFVSDTDIIELEDASANFALIPPVSGG